MTIWRFGLVWGAIALTFLFVGCASFLVPGDWRFDTRQSDPLEAFGHPAVAEPGNDEDVRWATVAEEDLRCHGRQTAPAP